MGYWRAIGETNTTASSAQAYAAYADYEQRAGRAPKSYDVWSST